METYSLEADNRKPDTKQRARMFLVWAGVYFVVLFSWKSIWPIGIERNEGLLVRALHALVVSILWAIGMTVWFRRHLPDTTILVDETSITAVSQYRGWMRWFRVQKRVRRGEIRTIWEVRGADGVVVGTAISENPKLRARLTGFVFLSTRLQDYEKLRALAVLWRSPDA
jgi:hypothetical protein